MLHTGRGIEKVFALLNYFKTAHYVILGQGPLKEDLEKKSVLLGIQNRVHFLGNIPYSKLLSYTASATIGFSLIEPITQSYVHALPNKIFEYAAVGLPVIATNLFEMEKVITKYKLGYCVNFEDEIILIKTVERILLNQSDKKYKPNQRLFWDVQTDIFLGLL